MYSKAFLVLSLVSAIVAGCSQKITKVPCPSGLEYIQKNPNKAYESYVKTSEINASGALHALNKIDSAKLGLGLKRQVTKLRTDLDNFSATNQDILKAAYLAYAQSPCDASVKVKYFDVLENVRSSNEAIAKLGKQINNIANTGNLNGVDEQKLKNVIEDYNQEIKTNSL